jgi:putative ABC transport system permease protein
MTDLRYALRTLLHDRTFTALVLATLALGIGANTAIFSVVHAVLLRAAPVRDIDRVALAWETDRNTGTTREPASLPDFLDFQQRSRTFETLGVLMADELNLTPVAGEPRRLAGLRVSSALLPMLGLSPVLGRTFTSAEAQPRGAASVVISEDLWAREFGRSAAALGSTIRLDDRAWTVVGVMPRGADYGVLQILSGAAYARAFADRGEKTEVSVWLPLQESAEDLPRSTHPLFMLGRLAPGATAPAAQQELAGIAADLERAFPDNKGRGVHVEPLSKVVTGAARPALLLLLGAVALVLMVACVNAANLLLARGAARTSGVAVRRALGASAPRLLRMHFIESAVLTAGSAALGVVLAYAGVRVIVALAPADVPRLSEAAVDAPVLATTLAVCAIVTILFGVIPAAQSARLDVIPALQSATARSGDRRSRTRLRQALVVAEVAFAVLLVCNAGLLIRSFWLLEHVDAGFRAGGVLKAEYQLPASRYPVDFRTWPDFVEQHAFNRALLARVESLPGVASAAIAGNHPLDPGFTNSFTIAGRESESRNWPEISVRRVTRGYFDTVGLALRRGRLFRDGDTTRGPLVAVINEAAVRRFFADRDPIGAQIRFWGGSRTIVGVVADEKFQGLAQPSPIAVYTPLTQTPSANGAGVLLLRTDGDPSALAASAQAAIRDVDSGLAVFGVEPLAVTVGRSVSQRRFTLTLMVIFAAVALLLAALGVYGALSYTVAQRRREIGIRMALGADPRAVAGRFVRGALGLTGGGVAIGFVGALGTTRLIQALLFGVAPTDPLTFALVAIVPAIVGLAGVGPAMRAARVDPLVALRSER